MYNASNERLFKRSITVRFFYGLSIKQYKKDKYHHFLTMDTIERIKPMGTAFIFPGQGSQTIGMGKSLFENFAIARDVFQEVDEALHFSLSHLMFEGDIEELTQTQNAQPAIMSVSIAVVRTLEKETGKKLKDMVSCVAGHSLGEYSALCAAGSLSLSDTAKLLRTRGLAMKEASQDQPSTMAALLGLSLADASKIAIKSSTPNEVCVIANDNCPGQVVISGHITAIDRALKLAADTGAKKAVKLSVSGAFHSPLMKSAEDKIRAVLNETPLIQPCVPLVSNITAEFEQNPDQIKELLISQVTGSVRWTESVQYMCSKGIADFIECGNGKILSGLIKRIDSGTRSISIGSAQEITAGLAFLA